MRTGDGLLMTGTKRNLAQAPSRTRAATIARKLDGRLQAANGSRRSIMSRKTIATLLRLIASGNRLAWARSHETTSGWGAFRSATIALCARLNAKTICLAIKRCPAKGASPGRAWTELTPWRPESQATTEKLQRWLRVQAEDRIRLTTSTARSVASEFLKLPALKIRFRRGWWSDSNDVFVMRDNSVVRRQIATSQHNYVNSPSRRILPGLLGTKSGVSIPREPLPQRQLPKWPAVPENDLSSQPAIQAGDDELSEEEAWRKHREFQRYGGKRHFQWLKEDPEAGRIYEDWLKRRQIERQQEDPTSAQPKRLEDEEGTGEEVRPLSETSESLIAYCRENNRVCPLPQLWHKLWEMLPNHSQVGGGRRPSPPLILAAWHDTPAMLKMLRLAEHIQWAEQYGALDTVAAFLRRLGEGDWFHIGD